MKTIHKVLIALIIGYLVYRVFITLSDADRMKALEQAQAKAKTEAVQEKGIASATPKLTQSQLDYMEKLIDGGLVNYEMESHKVYIKPALWEAADYKLKENLTAACAMYCAMKNGTDGIFIDVYDKQSGKQLAKYGVWGYKVL